MNPANLVLGTGDFALLGTCVGCVTMGTPLVYSPAPIFGVAYTANNLGFTTDFTTTALTSTTGNGVSTLGLEFDGIATLTGFDATPGHWVLTINQFGSLTGSFSASTIAEAVPEPTSLALLGMGVLGIAVVGRRRWV